MNMYISVVDKTLEETHKKMEFAYIQVLDEPHLRRIINKKNGSWSDVYKLLKVSMPELEVFVPSQSQLEEQVKLQKECVDNAMKFKYIISKVTQQYKWGPLLDYLNNAVSKYVSAEVIAYQALLNHLAYLNGEKKCCNHSNRDGWC